MALSSETLIANELLAFIQHAIDTMDEVSIMQICKSSFSEEEISSGKALLFQTLGKTAQMPSRRRDGTERSVQDIITLLKETDPDDVPAFVAKELHKLPSIGFDHVDVSRLLKDITFLKSSLADVQIKLEASNLIIGELRSELLSLKSNSFVTRSPEFDANNVNTNRRGAHISSVSSPVTPMTQVAASVDSRPAAATRCPAVNEPPPAPTPVTPRSKPYAAAAAATQSQQTTPKVRSSLAKTQPPRPQKDKKCDEEGFIKVERKKKKRSIRNHRGTAPVQQGQQLRGETPTTQLYVSRAHWSTKVEDVVDYISEKISFKLRVERLEPRHKVSFSSFVVRVPTHYLSTFMKEDFWPQGVVFRKFRGRLS